MTDIHDDLRRATVDAIRKARADMGREFGSDPIHGFALCTDDNLMTLYSAACTKSWVAEREAEYQGIGSIYVEWNQSAGDRHFESISKTLAALAESDQSTSKQRFDCLRLALEDCRAEGLFDSDTVLLCGNTDGVGEMEAEAVDRLNSTAIAGQVAGDLCVAEYGDDCVPADRSPSQGTGSFLGKLMAGFQQAFRRDANQLTSMEIVPGRGVEGCEIGFARDAAREVFGNTQSTSANYFEFPHLGVDVQCRKKRIDAIYFFFRTKNYEPFNGNTREGIGARSTAKQVVRTYGTPDKQDQGPTSSGGTYERLYYRRLGIEFNFRHNELEDIRVYDATDVESGP
ncbi:DUF4303 domain-containing protein [Allorhodopirellula solitaria]|uniref:Uncharacterized protein n=1 Tax=Allorhodopirellula solitaria TaxID=2527987 RepID=A0A5C5WP15_9BACT|nr:DUF4303 domain-containing protein [Allorhodopirellula solitaria]TWT51773.1 hypothetical protein CA85_51990 [Allorhodopirellula solitaria]